MRSGRSCWGAGWGMLAVVGCVALVPDAGPVQAGRAAQGPGSAVAGREPVVRMEGELYRVRDLPRKPQIRGEALWDAWRHWISKIEFSPDGKRLLVEACPTGHTLWNVETRQPAAHLAEGWLGRVLFAPDSRTLVTWSEEPPLVWDGRTGERLGALEGCPQGAENFAYSPDGRVLATGDKDWLRLYDAHTMRLLLPPLEQDDVHAIVFAPGGRTVAVADEQDREEGERSEDRVVLRQAATGRVQAVLRGQQSPVFSPDGRLLATLGDVPGLDPPHGETRKNDPEFANLWQLGGPRPRLLRRLQVGKYTYSKPNLFTFSRDGRRLIYWDGSGSAAQIWSVADGRRLMEREVESSRLNSMDWPWDGTCVLSKDTRLLAVEAEPGAIEIWDVEQGRRRAALPRAGRGFISLALSADGSRVAAGGADGRVQWWDVAGSQAPRLVATRQAHTSTVGGLAFSPDGARLASLSDDGTARIWDAASGELQGTLRNPTEEWNWPRTRRRYQDGGRTLVTLDEDGLMRGWDTASGRLRWRVVTPKDHPPFEDEADEQGAQNGLEDEPHLSSDGWTLAVPDTSGDQPLIRLWDFDPINRVPGRLRATLEVGGFPRGSWFTPDSQLIVAGTGAVTTGVWEVRSGRLLATFPSSTGSEPLLAPDNRAAVTVDDLGVVREWELRTGRLRHVYDESFPDVWVADRSPDGRRIVTGGRHCATLWDAGSGTKRADLRGHWGSVWAVAFSRDGRFLATASDDGTARIWDGRTGAPLRTLAGHEDTVLSLAFSPDGRWLATGSQDETARVWEVATGQLAATLEGHSAPVTGLAFSPDGQLLATAGAGWGGAGDRTARLWEAATGKPVAILAGHERDVALLVFSEDGTRLLTQDEAGTQREWDCRTGTLIGTQRPPAPRNPGP